MKFIHKGQQSSSNLHGILHKVDLMRSLNYVRLFLVIISAENLYLVVGYASEGELLTTCHQDLMRGKEAQGRETRAHHRLVQSQGCLTHACRVYVGASRSWKHGQCEDSLHVSPVTFVVFPPLQCQLHKAAGLFASSVVPFTAAPMA